MTDEKAYTEREVWTRNKRGWPPKPGPWHLVKRHLVKRRADRSYCWSLAAECGFHPDRYSQRCDDRPTAGKFCPKCIKAADLRQPPGSSSDGGAS